MTIISESVSFISASMYIVLGAVVAAYATINYRQYRRLSAFKGPWLAAWTDLWLKKAGIGIGPEQHLLLSNVFNEYGALARIGPTTLVTSSPDLMMRMNAARSPYVKGDWYDTLKMPPGQHNIFSQRDELLHARQRAQMADGFGGRTNKSIEPSIDKHVKNFISLVRRKYVSTETTFKPIDMARKASFFTLDVITDIAFGQPFGNVDTDTDMHDYIALTEGMVQAMIVISIVPLFRWFLKTDWIAKSLFPSDKSEKGMGKMVGVARNLVHKRYIKKEVDHRDMLSSFISRGVTEEDLVANSLLSILAGSDTTATTLRTIILNVPTDASVLRKLQAEIDDFYRDYLSKRDTDFLIPDSQANKLRYMQAVMTESLRIMPPATGLFTKVAPPEGDTIELDLRGTGSLEKIFIPGGTKIGISNWSILRSKAVFGHDADLFRPDRWMIDNVEKLARMEKVVDLNFGYGKYQCLGRPIAWMELNKCVFELFRNFDFQIVNPDNPWKSRNTGGLWIQSDMWVRVTERNANSKKAL